VKKVGGLIDREDDCGLKWDPTTVKEAQDKEKNLRLEFGEFDDAETTIRKAFDAFRERRTTRRNDRSMAVDSLFVSSRPRKNDQITKLFLIDGRKHLKNEMLSHHIHRLKGFADL